LLQRFRPELVFFQSGVDVLAGDRLGHMALSLDGLAARDRRIIEACHQTQTPLVVVMGGGYHRQLATAVDAHAQTFVLASEYFD
jgi:acetoin utilization deacetylase AcuC-like enzyme